MDYYINWGLCNLPIFKLPASNFGDTAPKLQNHQAQLPMAVYQDCLGTRYTNMVALWKILTKYTRQLYSLIKASI